MQRLFIPTGSIMYKRENLLHKQIIQKLHPDSQ